jgi:plasmid stabilization system protein ParE
MRIEYSRRALSDLIEIAAYYAAFQNNAGERVGARIREVAARIARSPQIGRPVVERPGVRVVPLRRYPYLIFYRVARDAVRIIHIRHTSRRPWSNR